MEHEIVFMALAATFVASVAMLFTKLRWMGLVLILATMATAFFLLGKPVSWSDVRAGFDRLTETDKRASVVTRPGESDSEAGSRSASVESGAGTPANLTYTVVSNGVSVSVSMTGPSRVAKKVELRSASTGKITIPSSEIVIPPLSSGAITSGAPAYVTSAPPTMAYTPPAYTFAVPVTSDGLVRACKRYEVGIDLAGKYLLPWKGAYLIRPNKYSEAWTRSGDIVVEARTVPANAESVRQGLGTMVSEFIELNKNSTLRDDNDFDERQTAAQERKFDEVFKKFIKNSRNNRDKGTTQAWDFWLTQLKVTDLHASYTNTVTTITK